MSEDVALDVIVRFHDVDRIAALDRCIFSLIGQEYRPLQICLVTQRFTSTAINETRKRLQPLLDIDTSVNLIILNWENPDPTDARSVLINLGLNSATGRYLAFLDYDDAIYPEAYRLLIDRLQCTNAAIAFGGTCWKVTEFYGNLPYVKSKKFPYKGSGLRSLFTQNFCPIHSFIVDRQRIPLQFLYFDPLITRAEDYDFLLRICSQFPSDFESLGKTIADYYIKTDGTNTINTEWAESLGGYGEWEQAEIFLEQRRRMTPISADVQRSLGLKPLPYLTIRTLLDTLPPD